MGTVCPHFICCSGLRREPSGEAGFVLTERGNPRSGCARKSRSAKARRGRPPCGAIEGIAFVVALNFLMEQNQITFSNDCGGVVPEDIREAALLAESYFHTEEDPTQLKASESNFSWIYYNFPQCMNIIKDAQKVIGLTFILPCTKIYMDDFLSKKMNECELFHKIQTTVHFGNFETIYVCLAYLKPAYRKLGLTLQSFIDSIQKLLVKKNNAELFYWAYSLEGKQLAEKIGEKLRMRLRDKQLL